MLRRVVKLWQRDGEGRASLWKLVFDGRGVEKAKRQGRRVSEEEEESCGQPKGWMAVRRQSGEVSA